MALTEPNGKLDLLSQCVCARLCVCECVRVSAADTVKDGASWHHCFHRKWCFQNSAFPLCSSPQTQRVCPRHHSESASPVWSRSPEAKPYHLTIKEKPWLLTGQIIFLLSRSPLKIHQVCGGCQCWIFIKLWETPWRDGAGWLSASEKKGWGEQRGRWGVGGEVEEEFLMWW